MLLQTISNERWWRGGGGGKGSFGSAVQAAIGHLVAFKKAVL